MVRNTWYKLSSRLCWIFNAWKLNHDSELRHGLNLLQWQPPRAPRIFYSVSISRMGCAPVRLANAMQLKCIG